jgi:hypothetical protein
MVNVIKLAINDFRNITRDRFLVFASIFYPILIIFFTRIIKHWIAPELSDTYGFLDLKFYPILFMLVAIMGPLLYGFITSFLIIDERDEHLLTVLRVMPISRNTYLLYRMFFLTIASFCVVMVLPLGTGLLNGTQFSYIEYIPIAILFSLFTPFSALLVGAFAQNKVQAFAIFKLSGTVFLAPIIGLFFDNIKYAFGFIPNFWTFMSLDILAKEGTLDLLHLSIGFAFHIALLVVLFYIFNKKN